MIDASHSANRAHVVGLLALITVAALLILAALLGLVFAHFLILAVPAIACALLALRIANRTNRAARVAATVVCVAGGSLLVGGGAWYFVRYQAEAPPGYLRVNFDEMFRDGGYGEIFAKVPVEIPAGIRLLIDQDICVKGYAFPPSRSIGITQFFMLQETKPFQLGSIQVILKEGQPWNWTNKPVAVSGRLILNPDFRGFLTDGQPTCKYLLIDAVVRPATTPFGLSRRPRSTC